MIDKRPASIARCAEADDVAEAVRFASERDLPLAVRGGGHNVAGTAVVDDGIVVDLSAMRGVRVEEDRRTVHVQGGATWARRRRRDRAARACRAGRRRFGDRRRGARAERRRLAPAPPRRDDDRQPGRLPRSSSRRAARACERRRAPRPLLGASRRRRQLRRRHRVRAPPAGARAGGVRPPRRVRARGHRQVLAGVARRGRGRAGRALDRWLVWSLPDVEVLPEELRGSRMSGIAGMWAGDPARASAGARRARARDAAARHERPRGLPRVPGALDPFFPRAGATTGRRCTSTGSPMRRSTRPSSGRSGARRTTRWSSSATAAGRCRAWRRTRPRSAIAARSGC